MKLRDSEEGFLTAFEEMMNRNGYEVSRSFDHDGPNSVLLIEKEWLERHEIFSMQWCDGL